MTTRKKRLDKLIQLRTKELDRRVSALVATRNEERSAEESAALERNAEQRAEQKRKEVVSRPMDATSLVEATDFLVSCARRRELADLKLQRARRAVQKAQGEVQGAKNELRKIELLTERLEAEERAQAARLEQRATDELVTLRQGGEASKRRSPS
jgi:flagellar export protein FliJ